MSQTLPSTQTEVMNLPRNHYLSVLVHENDQVMAFFNEAILYDYAAVVLEEAKVEGYEKLGLVNICHKAIQNCYMFYRESTETKLK